LKSRHEKLRYSLDFHRSEGGDAAAVGGSVGGVRGFRLGEKDCRLRFRGMVFSICSFRYTANNSCSLKFIRFW
jgi:hypothetical protein